MDEATPKAINVRRRFDLERFLRAQDDEGTYERAREELRSGRKTSHWMWFVFPQIAGLGQSSMSQRFAISSIEEATAYLEHPILGARLRECAEILLASGAHKAAQEIFGEVDALKLRSSMTLFAAAAGPEERCFRRVLERYFQGHDDLATLARI